MHKSITAIFALFLIAGLQSVRPATPDATYFVGLISASTSFAAEAKEGNASVDYSDRMLGMGGGFRGNYTQIAIEYMPEKSFSEKGVETDLGYLGFAFSFYESLDLFFASAGGRVDQISGSTELGTFPESLVPSLFGSFGAFLGNKFSVELGYSLGPLPFENSSVKIKDLRSLRLAGFYHF